MSRLSSLSPQNPQIPVKIRFCMYQKTDISLNCPAEDQTLVNRNYIVKKLFKWDDTCRSVSLKFKVGNQTLEKVYDGENAVLDFLLNFKTGKKRFILEEFSRALLRT